MWESLKSEFLRCSEYVSWRARTRIASFTLRHWKGILWTGELLIFLISCILIFTFLPNVGWSKIGVVLTIFFGLVSCISLIVSITVLHFVRDLIPHYSQAGKAFEKIIRDAKHTLFILTENPAFLQVLDHRGLESYFKILFDRLTQGSLQRVVFAYVNRPILIGNKIPAWAKTLNLPKDQMVQELFSPYAFALAGNPKLKNHVFLIPLKTSSLPFFMAIADEDQIAMFCRSKMDDSNIHRSILRGFVTFDPYITRALRSVFLKSVELDAVVYQYKCTNTACTTQLTDYMFDHHLVQANNALNSTNADQIPIIPCKSCNSNIQGEPKDLSDLLPDEKVKLFEEVFGTAPED